MVRREGTPYNSAVPFTRRVSPNHRRPRFRLPVHTVDCPPAARAVGLLGDPAVRHADRRDRRRRPVGIILSGGPKSVSEDGAPRCEPAVFEAGVPVLGICYGMQLMTAALGGEVAPAPHREFGLATIRISAERAALRVGAGGAARLGQPRRLRRRGAAGFAVTATSANAPVAAMAAPDRGSTRSSSTRRLHIPIAAPTSSATSPTKSAAAPATGRWPRS